MSRRTFILAAALIATGLALWSAALCGIVHTADAYSINGPAPTTTLPFIPSIGSFNSFIQSINNIGAQSGISLPPVNVPSMPQNGAQNGAATNWFQNTFQQFDAWLYGVAGFHAILNILSWLLGIVKSGVDWVLGVIH